MCSSDLGEGQSSGYARERRPRKTGNSTVLDLPEALRSALLNRYNSLIKPDSLIFTTVKNKPIDDHTFSQRVWKAVLKSANVPHRPPYATRHSFASHALDQGSSLTDVAHLLGHTDTRMVASVYAHIVKRPPLPNLNI